ncbi:BMC domain-containing protein [Streptosporangium violaceochromogenes]|nr:BMC domain-containing protein [Streptosporangium violaceochromogenes]
MAHNAVELRTYAFVDRLQPQMAALLGSVMSGDPVIEGMSQLYLEISPGSDVYALVDAAVKASGVRPGSQVVERQYGMTELHSASQEAVRQAGRTILDLLGITAADAHPAELVSAKIVSNIDPHQAQLVNRSRKGSLLVAGESMLVVECQPAAYISAVGNEVEKSVSIKIVDVRGVGQFGRLWISGLHSEVESARDAVRQAFEKTPWSQRR